MDTEQQYREDLEREGRVWLRGAVSAEELAGLAAHLAEQGRPAGRVSLASPLGKAVAASGFAGQIGRIWPGMRPVRLVGFGKSASENWAVPWHQDRIIAVDRQAEVDGYTNWSRKSGVWHCEPPVEILQQMLFVRVHLDANRAENGAMEIARRSHLAERVRTEDAETIAQGYAQEATEADPGDVLVLKMLTLHRSLPSQSTAARRVLRVDFAAMPLAPPLGWAA